MGEPDLFDAARNVNKDPDAAIGLLWLVIAWAGADERQLRTAATAVAQDRHRLGQALAHAAETARIDPCGAYQALFPSRRALIPAIGPSLFTRFLYIAGAGGTDHRAQVLDNSVATTLRGCGWATLETRNRWSAAVYEQYCDLLSGWASEHDTRPDLIAQWLRDPGAAQSLVAEDDLLDAEDDDILLEDWQADLDRYLRSRRRVWQNEDERYYRNWVRHTAVPDLPKHVRLEQMLSFESQPPADMVREDTKVAAQATSHGRAPQPVAELDAAGAARRRRTVLRGGVAALAASAVLAAGAVWAAAHRTPPAAEADNGSSSLSSTPASERSAPSAQQATTQPTEAVIRADPYVERVVREYSQAGLTSTLVLDLNRVANSTRYGPTPGGVPDKTLITTAYVMLHRCAIIEAGDSTWAQEQEIDILDGAPPSSAATMNAYLRNTFCPKVDASGYR